MGTYVILPIIIIIKPNICSVLPTRWALPLRGTLVIIWFVFYCLNFDFLNNCLLSFRSFLIDAVKFIKLVFYSFAFCA